MFNFPWDVNHKVTSAIVDKCTGQIVEFTIFRIFMHNIVTANIFHFVVGLVCKGPSAI